MSKRAATLHKMSVLFVAWQLACHVQYTLSTISQSTTWQTSYHATFLQRFAYSITEDVRNVSIRGLRLCVRTSLRSTTISEDPDQVIDCAHILREEKECPLCALMTDAYRAWAAVPGVSVGDQVL